jgi:hypothetical protein
VTAFQTPATSSTYSTAALRVVFVLLGFVYFYKPRKRVITLDDITKPELACLVEDSIELVERGVQNVTQSTEMPAGNVVYLEIRRIGSAPVAGYYVACHNLQRIVWLENVPPQELPITNRAVPDSEYRKKSCFDIYPVLKLVFQAFYLEHFIGTIS